MPTRLPILLAPLRYLAVRHPVKRRWDIVFPAFGAFGLTAGLLFWPAVPSPYGPGGFLPSLQTLFAILGGFFVSALTLITTSSNPSLAQPLAGSPPVRVPGEASPPTRQRFLCLLFGYLAFSAFALYGTGFMAMLLAPGVKTVLPAPLHRWASGTFLLAYGFWLSHVFVSTLVGLYYFTDRLQRIDPEIVRREQRPVSAE